MGELHPEEIAGPEMRLGRGDELQEEPELLVGPLHLTVGLGMVAG